MGTEYYVACRDCKKFRGLDKFYAITITSFLWQHKGHNCTLFSEHDEEFMSMVPLADEPQPGDYEDDSDKFWKA